MSSPNPEREHFGGILGIAVGMLLIPLLGLSAWNARGSAVDGAEVLAEVFGGPVPSGYELDAAYALPGGDRVVTVRDPAFEEPALPEPEAPEEDAEETGADAGRAADEPAAANAAEGEGGAPELFQRPQVDEITTPTPPHTLHCVMYRSATQVTELFDSGSSGSGRRGRRGRGGGGGGMPAGMDMGGDMSHMVVERGELQWGPWRAAFVRDREFLSAGHFVDTVRVNLSSSANLCVLYATWPRDHRPAQEKLEALLAGWEFRGGPVEAEEGA